MKDIVQTTHRSLMFTCTFWLLLGICPSSGSAAIEEGFENGLGDWTVFDACGAGNCDVTQSSGQAHSGTYSCRIRIRNNGGNELGLWRKFSGLKPNTTGSVDIWYRINDGGNQWWMEHHVWLHSGSPTPFPANKGNNNGDTDANKWTQRLPKYGGASWGEDPGTGGDWEKRTILITTNANGEAWIGFVGGSHEADVNVFIDDIDFDVVFDDTCTPPAAPAVPVVSNITATGFSVTNNPADPGTQVTAFRLRSRSGGATQFQWIQPDGTLGTEPAWQTKNVWGTVAVTGLTHGFSYSVQAQAAIDQSGTCTSGFSPQFIATTSACSSSNLVPNSDFESNTDDPAWTRVGGGRGTADASTIDFHYNPSGNGHLPDGGWGKSLHFSGVNIDVGAAVQLTGMIPGGTYNLKIRSHNLLGHPTYAEVLLKDSPFTDVDPSGGTLLLKWQTGFGAPDCGLWNGGETSACHTATTSFTATAGTMYLLIRVGDNSQSADVVFDNLQVCLACAPPAAPGVPDLAAASDTGISNADNITSQTNGLVFTVGGVASGDTVRIKAGSTVLGTAVAGGPTVNVTTTVALAHGAHTITATRASGGCESPASPGLNITVDTAAPTVTINQASGQADPADAEPINFTATFSEPVDGFGASGDVVISGTAGGTQTVTITGTGPYNCAVSGMTTNGTVIASIPAGVCTDVAGNANAVSTSTDNTVTWSGGDNTPPSIANITPSDACVEAGSSISLTADIADEPGGSGVDTGSIHAYVTGANLIQNPGAELGITTHWTLGGDSGIGDNDGVFVGDPDPLSGAKKWKKDIQDGSYNSFLYQSVSTVAGASYYVRAYAAVGCGNAAGSFARARLVWIDGAHGGTEVEIGRVEAGVNQSENWTLISGIIQPTGTTATIKMYLEGNANSFVFAGSHVDDFAMYQALPPDSFAAGTATWNALSITAAGPIQIQATDNAGNTAVASSPVINLNPAVPTSPAATPSTICVGESSMLSATVGEGEEVEWFIGSCGDTPVTSPVSPAVTTTYYARARNTATGCTSSACATVAVTVNEPANITDQPDGLTRCEGESASFTVVATNATAYQWRKGGTPLADGGNISGVNTPTLTINPVSAADASSYDCVLTDACGQTPSDPAVLTVDVAPSIIIDAPSVTATNTGPVSFIISYTGATGISLAPGDVTLIKTDTADATVGVSGSGNLERAVTLTGITGDGTLAISLAAATAVNNACPADAAGASAMVLVDNTAPAISITSATQDGQPLIGTATHALQGSPVLLSVTAGDGGAGLDGIPAVTVTPQGGSAEPASFIDENPAGTFNYSWTVQASTPNGPASIDATVDDLAGNTGHATAQQITVNKNQISGYVAFETINGTHIFDRDVVFTASDSNGAALETWTVTLSFTSYDPDGDALTTNNIAEAGYVLTDVPDGTAQLSAKTSWALRRKLVCDLAGSTDGQVVTEFVGANALLGGDLDGSNSVNILDYTRLKVNWNTNFAASDINGDGVVNLLDYNILKTNFAKIGSPAP